jgi:hypothetical protein
MAAESNGFPTHPETVWVRFESSSCANAGLESDIGAYFREYFEREQAEIEYKAP